MGADRSSRGCLSNDWYCPSEVQTLLAGELALNLPMLADELALAMLVMPADELTPARLAAELALAMLAHELALAMPENRLCPRPGDLFHTDLLA